MKAKRRLSGRLIALVMPQRWTLLFGLLFLAGGAGINLAFPEIIRRILNDSDAARLLDNFALIALTLIGLLALQAICYFMRSYLFGVIGQKVVAVLRQDLFRSLINQEVAFFDSSRVGDLISRLASDTVLLQNSVSINISVLLRYVLQVIVGVVLMLLISVRLTCVILILLPALVAISVHFAKRLRRASRKTQEELGHSNVVAEESNYAIRTVKAFGREEYEIGRYTKAIDKTLSFGIERARVSASFQSIVSFLMNCSVVLLLWYGVHLVAKSALSIGDLTGFLLYGVIVAVSFALLTRVFAEFVQALGAAERVFEILDRQPKLSGGAGLPVPQRASLRFEEISFSYPARAERQVLSAVSFEVAPGEVLALVGPSGAGKSTIVNLLLRFYDPQAGRISLGNFDLKQLDLAGLREHIAVVAQDPELFSVSIGENIAYGNLNASHDEIREAARAANILEFIESLPQKFSSAVGDRGVQLSGGQKQRLAIARAMLKNPALLILDEATAALDSENEALVQEALKRLMKGRTTIVIAHRLSTVKDADQLLVLDQGCIVQRGTHRDLSASSGLYRQLLERQELSA